MESLWGKKQMLWLLQCYYIHKIYFIGGGGVYTGGNEIFALCIIYHRLIQVLWVIFLFLPFHSYKTLQYF